jgi:hypothetical protein
VGGCGSPVVEDHGHSFEGVGNHSRHSGDRDAEVVECRSGGSVAGGGRHSADLAYMRLVVGGSRSCWSWKCGRSCFGGLWGGDLALKTLGVVVCYSRGVLRKTLVGGRGVVQPD